MAGVRIYPNYSGQPVILMRQGFLFKKKHHPFPPPLSITAFLASFARTLVRVPVKSIQGKNHVSCRTPRNPSLPATRPARNPARRSTTPSYASRQQCNLVDKASRAALCAIHQSPLRRCKPRKNTMKSTGNRGWSAIATCPLLPFLPVCFLLSQRFIRSLRPSCVAL